MNNCLYFIFSFLFLCLTGCSLHSPGPSPDTNRYVGPTNRQDELITRFSPIFQVPGWDRPHNRIGLATAAKTDEVECISVDPDRSVIYAGTFPFSTANGNYSNLVYRIHFSDTPFSLFPFYLTAGKNPGILVIITMDNNQNPLLVTTVQTCGCYIAIVPTAHLSVTAYPEQWPDDNQNIYGELLPAILPPYSADDLLVIQVRPEIHRVSALSIISGDTPLDAPFIEAEVMNLESLKALQLPDGGSTSFYYQTWPLQGHVKGAIKPWESLLLSLISFDFYVGMDKEFTGTGTGANPFYTSLKVWNRRVSDMNDFPGFLKFYGWKL
ncbi:hypothetical protein UWK_02161 [Desulfocapsa sulfexigens DSM 10523]|uniref:Lipoprotein n=1 Tax=Desulfocapsa sulfexigens (strain DSM 10523 / SB164P1) TaxID=1167006 RepID=M1PAM1_DESSD|nr:hypothetical protein [Desulfocapsa sulfexigens]AGF78702.1 hypothetical protein UWK_02161 [Desulfocapsa sulfexigens DSM 10523]